MFSEEIDRQQSDGCDAETEYMEGVDRDLLDGLLDQGEGGSPDDDHKDQGQICFI